MGGAGGVVTGRGAPGAGGLLAGRAPAGTGGVGGRAKRWVAPGAGGEGG
jgi:hypothetical protein